MPARGRNTKSKAEFEFKATDKVSPTADRIITRIDRLAASVRVLDGPLGGISGRLTALATSLKRFGFATTISNTALAALIQSVKIGLVEFTEFEETLNRVQRQIDLLGRSTNLSAEALDGFNVQLGEFTLASAKELNKVASVILSFQGAAEHTEDILRFSQTIAENTGKSITSVARSISKALDDPKRGLASLGRSFLNLSEAQREAIKGFQEMGQQSKSVELIMTALSDKVAGQSAGQTPSLARSMDTLGERTTQAFRNVGEVVGPLAKWVVDVAASVVGAIEDITVSGQGNAQLARRSAKEFLAGQANFNDEIRAIRADDTLNAAERVEKIFLVEQKLERLANRRDRVKNFIAGVSEMDLERQKDVDSEKERLATLAFLSKEAIKIQEENAREQVKIARKLNKDLRESRRDVFKILSADISETRKLGMERQDLLNELNNAERVSNAALDKVRIDEIKSIANFNRAKTRLADQTSLPGGLSDEEREVFSVSQERFLKESEDFNARRDKINASAGLINAARNRVELKFSKELEKILEKRKQVRESSFDQTEVEQLTARFNKLRLSKIEAGANEADLAKLDEDFNKKIVKVVFAQQDKRAAAFFKNVETGVDKVKGILKRLEEDVTKNIRADLRVDASVKAVKKGGEEIAKLIQREISLSSIGGDRTQKNIAEARAAQQAFLEENFGKTKAALAAEELLNKEFNQRSLAIDQSRRDRLDRDNQALTDKFESALDKVQRKQAELTEKILVKTVRNLDQRRKDLKSLAIEISSDVRNIISAVDKPTARLTDTKNIDIIETQTNAIVSQLQDRFTKQKQIVNAGQKNELERNKLLLEVQQKFQDASLAIATQGGKRIAAINNKRLADLSKLRNAETEQERFNRLSKVINDLIAEEDKLAQRAILSNDTVTRVFNSIAAELKLINVGGIRTDEALEQLLNRRIARGSQLLNNDKLIADLRLKLEEDFSVRSAALDASRQAKLLRQFNIFVQQIGSATDKAEKKALKLISSVRAGFEAGAGSADSIDKARKLIGSVGDAFTQEIEKISAKEISLSLQFEDDDTFQQINDRSTEAIASLKRITDNAKSFLDRELSDKTLAIELKKKLDLDYQDFVDDINGKTADKITDKWRTALSGFAGFADSISGIARIDQEMATAKVEKEGKARERAIKSEFDTGLQALVDTRNAGDITDTEFSNRRNALKEKESKSLIALEQQQTAALNKEAKKAFDIKKKFDLASAALKGGLAVMNAYAAGSAINPAAGTAFALAAAAFVGKQLQQIESTTFSPNVSSTRPSPKPLRNIDGERNPNAERAGTTTINVFGTDQTNFSKGQVDSVMDAIEQASDRGDRVLFNRRSRQRLELSN